MSSPHTHEVTADDGVPYVDRIRAPVGIVGWSAGSAPGGPPAPPVLVLHGPDTRPFFTAAAQHVAEHVPGAGHAAPLTHPEPLADALAGFFAERW